MIGQIDPEGEYNWMDEIPDFEADRASAIAWARQILTTDFVILDTETTGLTIDDEAVSIAVLSKEGQMLFSSLLCHEKPSDPRALATHGITWEMTRDAPKFAEVADQVFGFIGGRDVLGYNVTFDLRILSQMIVRYNLGDFEAGAFSLMPPKTAHDVMSLFAQFYGDWSAYHQSYTWKKLTYAAAYLGIETNGAHGAAADCLMTLRVVRGWRRRR